VAEEMVGGRQRRPKLRAVASKHQKERRKRKKRERERWWWWRRPGGVGKMAGLGGGSGEERKM
jgi:hypothetical protein